VKSNVICMDISAILLMESSVDTMSINQKSIAVCAQCVIFSDRKKSNLQPISSPPDASDDVRMAYLFRKSFFNRNDITFKSYINAQVWSNCDCCKRMIGVNGIFATAHTITK